MVVAAAAACLWQGVEARDQAHVPAAGGPNDPLHRRRRPGVAERGGDSGAGGRVEAGAPEGEAQEAAGSGRPDIECEGQTGA